MTSKENIASPEERLLRLIKGQPHPASQPLNAAVVRKDSLSRLALLQRLNSGLFIFWGLLLIAILVFTPLETTEQLEDRKMSLTGFIKTMDMSNSPRKYSSDDSSQKEAVQAQEKFQPRPFSYYAGIIASRNLFKTGATASSRDTGNSEPGAPVELLGNYSLSGVIGGENPQAIIEDKKSGRTYFLNRGQYLGDFKIEDILEGRVILEFKGQKLELAL